MTAMLQVNCALGDVPRERSVEGIRLTFEKGGNELSEEMSGRVIFLAMRPEFGGTAKTAASEPVSDSPKSSQSEPGRESLETPRN
jgi:hypothetical protein